MGSLLTTVPEVEYATLGELQVGTWALGRRQVNGSSELIPLVYIDQDERGASSRVLLADHAYPGIHHLRSDTEVLVLAGHVDAKIHVNSIRQGLIGDMASGKLTLAVDRAGMSLVATEYRAATPTTETRAVDLSTGKLKDLPHKCSWTDQFTLRLRSEATDELMTLAEVGPRE